MKKFVEKITDGLIASNTEEVKRTAIQFIKDNGFRLHTAAKGVACSEVQQIFERWSEEENKDYTELSVAIQAAIMSLSESDLTA